MNDRPEDSPELAMWRDDTGAWHGSDNDERSGVRRCPYPDCPASGFRNDASAHAHNVRAHGGERYDPGHQPASWWRRVVGTRPN